MDLTTIGGSTDLLAVVGTVLVLLSLVTVACWAIWLVVDIARDEYRIHRMESQWAKREQQEQDEHSHLLFWCDDLG